ncbi:MAG: hypothetical protein MMC23_005115 [Stictis urceolatum]|nr:hypothetical protein [Stictis urceolata]
MTITPITSASQLNTILSSSTYVVADFYADWCGPCKAIAPVFSQLAQAESKPGKMAFVKIDVDSQQSIARQYGVSAMPTFLIFKNSSVNKTLRGADPNGLRSAVLAASADAAKSGAKASVSFQTRGHVLGGGDMPSRVQRGDLAEQGRAWIAGLLPAGFMDAVIRFLGLYVVTLFSLDPKAAAENSVLNVGQGRVDAAKKRR